MMISTMASPGPAHLPVDGALGDGHLDRAAALEGDAALAAENGLFQIDLRLDPQVLTTGGRRAEAASAPTTAAKHLAQDIVEIDALEAGAGGGAAESATAERVTAAKAAHGLAPVRIDLARVEAPAFFLVAQKVEGGADPLEALLGHLIAGVFVRMKLFGELVKGAANLRLAGRTGHAEFLIGVLRQWVSRLRVRGDRPSIKRFSDRRKRYCDKIAT